MKYLQLQIKNFADVTQQTEADTFSCKTQVK